MAYNQPALWWPETGDVALVEEIDNTGKPQSRNAETDQVSQQMDMTRGTDSTAGERLKVKKYRIWQASKLNICSKTKDMDCTVLVELP